MHAHDDDPRTDGALAHLVAREADARAAIGLDSDRAMGGRDTRTPSFSLPGSVRLDPRTSFMRRRDILGPPSVRFAEGSPRTPPGRHRAFLAAHDDEPDVDLNVAPLSHDVALDQFKPD